MSGGLREAREQVAALHVPDRRRWGREWIDRGNVLAILDAALASEADTHTATESRPRARLREARAAIRDATRQIHETNEVLAAKLPAILASEGDTRETEHIIGPGFYRRMYGPPAASGTIEHAEHVATRYAALAATSREGEG